MPKNNKQVVLIAGGSGLVGGRLIHMLDKHKYEIVVLTRNQNVQSRNTINYVVWNTEMDYIESIPSPDHIINLAGAGIADERWTENRKRLIVKSRVDSAKTIKTYLTKHKIKPLTYIASSAVGYYGDRKAELLTEKSKPGVGFLSECCIQCENEAKAVGNLCERNVILRLGIVISNKGGALPKMLMTKRFGILNYFGNGRQYYPWIHIDDLCRMIIQSIENNDYRGIYNAVSPQQITNKQMMEEIIETNSMNAILIPIPVFSLRLLMGEMANVVLNSNRVLSDKIINTGFKFHYTNIGKAVKSLLE